MMAHWVPLFMRGARFEILMMRRSTAIVSMAPNKGAYSLGGYDEC